MNPDDTPTDDIINILGKPYAINYLSETQSCGTLGSASRAKQVINLNIEANGPAQLEDTLLHEVLHIIDEELKVGLTEDDIARLAVGLYSAGYRRSV